MKYQLVDVIESLEPGKRIVTRKNLSLAEEYLADHFPTFPVMPGVLMLEALTQSAAWLVRVEQDFARSVVVLSAARNVKYGHFVAPGHTLHCEVEAVKLGEDVSKFKAEAIVDGKRAVSARLELMSFNLVRRAGYLAESDVAVTEQVRRAWSLVGGPAALAGAKS
jgi:3-hydroxyacyl-[acyl-carrier-protein] dehydratase